MASYFVCTRCLNVRRAAEVARALNERFGNYFFYVIHEEASKPETKFLVVTVDLDGDLDGDGKPSTERHLVVNWADGFHTGLIRGAEVGELPLSPPAPRLGSSGGGGSVS